jgi:hypothetical protein
VVRASVASVEALTEELNRKTPTDVREAGVAGARGRSHDEHDRAAALGGPDLGHEATIAAPTVERLTPFNARSAPARAMVSA